tara:strand:+ start:9217 stop:11487 length:2271 start_codon:yes stop_codon:yes gene_type:complete
MKKYKYTGIYSDHKKVLDKLSDAQEAEKDLREQAREAHLFVDKRDGQWEPERLNANANGDKPRYTFDMCNPIVDQVVSEIEQADFDIQVNPAGGDGTTAIAATYDGIIRNIEVMSNSKHIYSQSARGMVISGIDGWRVVQKYASDDTFDQDLAIEKIHNFVDRVWFDPSAQEQDKSDAKCCFVLHPISREEYKSRWKEGSEEGVSEGRDGDAYYDKAETIVVGELLYVEERPRELVLLSNGQVHVAEEYEPLKEEMEAMGVTEEKRRTRQESYVCSRFFDNKDWLEEKRETVFSNIPIVPIYGNYKVYEDKPIYWGVVEKLFDTQRVLNYSISRQIEEGALAPRAKYFMTPTQAAGHEATLETLNTNNHPVQFYNADPEAPVPTQQGGAQINAGLTQISESMRVMMSYTSGMFAANMGDNPRAQSGVAIETLQNKGDNSTVKYFSALKYAIAATGRILIKAIPKIYDTRRTVRILKEDKTYDYADINGEIIIDTETNQPMRLNDLSRGSYDIQVNAGPSFQNRQAETREAITALAQIDPTIIDLAGDILLDNIETAGAKQISDRKRQQMVNAGLIPQNQLTNEEITIMQQTAMQEPPPDPALLLAQAEMTKADAELMKAQTDVTQAQNAMFKLQIDAEKTNNQALKDQAANAVAVFKAQTDRFKVQTDAQEVGAKLNESAGKQLGQQLDNINKELDNEHKEMENYEKFEQITNPVPDALIAITEVSDNMVNKPTGKSALNKMVDVGQSAMRRMTDA